MIVIGTIVVLAIFLLVGWAVSVEMFQQRIWRRRVQQGDTRMLEALIREGLNGWRRMRPPKGTPPAIWAAIQNAELVAVTEDSATVSTSAEAEFRTEEGQRRQVRSALDDAMAVAARLAEMLLYDVPSVRLYEARVDVYSTFATPGGVPEQRPILSLTADRPTADELEWERFKPDEIIARFASTFERGPQGEGRPINLPEVPGTLPGQPDHHAGSEPPETESTWDTSASSPPARATEKD